jgi:hypothetical protein
MRLRRGSIQSMKAKDGVARAASLRGLFAARRASPGDAAARALPGNGEESDRSANELQALPSDWPLAKLGAFALAKAAFLAHGSNGPRDFVRTRYRPFRNSKISAFTPRSSNKGLKIP